MSKIRIFAPRREEKAIVRMLQKMSAIDCSAEQSEQISAQSTQNQTDFVKLSAEADAALKIINSVAPEKKGLLASFSGRRKVTSEEFLSAADICDETTNICKQIKKLDRAIAEKKAAIVRSISIREQLSPWLNLDIPLSFEGTEKTSVFIGLIQGTYTLEDLLCVLAKAAPSIEPYAEIIGHTAGQTLIFITTPKADQDEMTKALRATGFAKPAVVCEVTAREETDRLLSQEENLTKEIQTLQNEIISLADHRQNIELVSDWYLSEAERQKMQNSLTTTRHTVLIEGYVPTCDLPYVTEKLEKSFTAYIESSPAKGDDVPVKLKNNAFTEPSQSITSMYSLPSSADIDPTPITSFFYYLFFGLMLSDAGYGILMWIATWAVNRFLDPEPNMRKNMKLFMYCGISTTFWGFFFGSFFGVDIITAISKAITGHGLPFKYPFIMPLDGDALAMLIMSVAFGFVQIIAGLCVKFYMTAKQESLLDAILDTGLWITTLCGFGVMAIGLITLPVLQTVGIAVAVASMAGIVIFGGRKKKGAMKFIGGIASLYDITGYVSDLLSFSRLMALGLTTAAMSMVFNKLGLMVSAGIIGKVFMIVILLVGHAVNFGLNALGAYVHTLRLQYVELFSKFYEGGGKPFVPFAFKGKYIRIKEEK